MRGSAINGFGAPSMIIGSVHDAIQGSIKLSRQHGSWKTR
jgi:hypothetical protein